MKNADLRETSFCGRGIADQSTGVGQIPTAGQRNTLEHWIWSEAVSYSVDAFVFQTQAVNRICFLSMRILHEARLPRVMLPGNKRLIT